MESSLPNWNAKFDKLYLTAVFRWIMMIKLENKRLNHIILIVAMPCSIQHGVPGGRILNMS